MSFYNTSTKGFLSFVLLTVTALPSVGAGVADTKQGVSQAKPASAGVMPTELSDVAAAPDKSDGMKKAASMASDGRLEKLKAAMAAAEKRRLEALKADPAAPNKELAKEWGVEVIGISQTAGGYMLDFRFRVVDAGKALPLFDHRIKPYVTAVKSGINLPVPVGSKTGAMRPTNRGKNIKADKNYYMVFANPDKHLKPGDKVAVVIGDFKVEDLTVN